MNNIAFESIGISFNIDPVAIRIGSWEIFWYAIIILTGFLLGTMFVLRSCEKQGVTKDCVWDVAIIGLIAGIIGARIYYVIFSFGEFDSVLEMFQIWNGGLAIYGGIISAVISTYIYCRVKKFNVLNVFDVCCAGLFIGQAIGRFGNFVNAEVYGRETSSLFGMSINGGAPVHPLFFYESLWNLAGLMILIALRGRKKADGQVFCFYVFWYSLGRLFLEGMRNSRYILYIIPNVLGASQLVAGILIAASVAAFVYLQRRACKTI